jgi:predicted nucleic acid-binding protein
MKYLLDVNLLVAWGWADHSDHRRVTRWIDSRLTARGDKLLTSAIPQMGFVRVSIQRSSGQVTPEFSGKILAGLLAVLGDKHEFLPDDQDATAWPSWCQGASRTTDAHLLALATAHGAQLATLDAGIPGAFLLP